MNDTRQLRTTWLEYLRSNRMFSPTTPQGFEQLVHRHVNALTKDILNNLTSLKPEQRSEIEEKANRLRNARLADPASGFKQLTDTYSNLHSHWKHLSNERRQHDWATTVDHLKVFVWRTAQAAMIAIIVLMTAYTADRLGIPLPLLRLTS